MNARLQLSAGEIAEWLPPLLFACAAFISTWVLADALRRRFASYAVAAWTLAALVSPPVVLPLYLVARIYKQKPDAPEPEGDPPARAETERAGDAPLTAEVDGAPTSMDASAQPLSRATRDETRRPARRMEYALPFLYALAVLCAGAIYFYRDYHSFDAYLTRAANERLRGRRDASIRSYRAALRLSDDAHTRKLLALQLAEDGQQEAALAEFRAAERGGEPDALLPYRMALLLDALARPAEAIAEFERFSRGGFCAETPPDARCADASARARQIRASSGSAIAH